MESDSSAESVDSESSDHSASALGSSTNSIVESQGQGGDPQDRRRGPRTFEVRGNPLEAASTRNRGVSHNGKANGNRSAAWPPDDQRSSLRLLGPQMAERHLPESDLMAVVAKAGDERRDFAT